MPGGQSGYEVEGVADRASVPSRPTQAVHSNSGTGFQANSHGDGDQVNSYGVINGPVTGPVSFYQGSGTLQNPVQECLKSLAFLEMEDRSRDVLRTIDGTCAWLLRHEKYKHWAKSDKGLLWIMGKPGSGKSTLLQYALDHIDTTSELAAGGLALSFFFHGRGVELQKTPLGLYRSLLHQLGVANSEWIADLTAAFQRRCEHTGSHGEKWEWHPNELQSFFRISVAKALQSRPVWLFIDALDEGGKDVAVNIIKEFKSLLRASSSMLSKCQFRVCFTCRHYPILDLGSGFQISVERENRNDIDAYVRAELATFRTGAAAAIPQLIIDRASGVFMWARIVAKKALDLQLDAESLDTIQEEIFNIPKDLDDLYRGLIHDMRQRPGSLKLIQWICYALRPLSLEELRWAFVFDNDFKFVTLSEWQTTKDYTPDLMTMERKLKTLTCGLAEVVRTTDYRAGRLIVQFIHQSVKDFFLQGGLLGLASSSDLVPQSATTSTTDLEGITNHQLFKACTRCLRVQEIYEVPVDPIWHHMMSVFPFVEYAATSWIGHAQKAENCRDPVHGQVLLDSLGWPSEGFIPRWWSLCRREGIGSRFELDRRPGGGTTIHLLSRYQLMTPLRIILQNKHQTDLDVRDDDGTTPLSYAAEHGQSTVVQLLFGTGKTDIDSKDMFGRTPLLKAARAGHQAVVQLLLCIDQSDINWKDNEGLTPLSWAAIRGHQCVVQLLLETQRVDINSKHREGFTPLMWASRGGHPSIVDLLLSIKHAEVDSRDNYGRTALSWAAQESIDVARLLISTGQVKVDSRDNDGRTPLSWAAHNSDRAIVELLLTTGLIDLDSRDISGRTPLSWAAEFGNNVFVSDLIDTGKVEVDSKDNNGRTPLSYAENVCVAQRLIDSGLVDINSRDKDGRTPLSWAVCGRWNKGVVKLLLGLGQADVESRDHHGRTPLSWAVSVRGNEENIGVLISLGHADVSSHDNDGRTVSSWSADGFDTQRLKDLAMEGWDSSSSSQWGDDSEDNLEDARKMSFKERGWSITSVD